MICTCGHRAIFTRQGDLSLAHPHVVRWETTRHAIDLAVPPVVHAVGLLDDADAVAVSER
jgi:hypothetical protein